MRDDKVDALREFMFRGFFKGITMNYSEFSETQAVANDASRRRDHSLLKSHRGGGGGGGDDDGAGAEGDERGGHIDMRDDETVFSLRTAVGAALDEKFDLKRQLSVDGGGS